MRLGFGAWRFLLAVLVAVSHLWGGMIHGPAAYAVWGFFVLSGYLMTLVLGHKYGTDAAGIRAYAANRVLRIYPSYVVAVLLGIATIWVLRRLGADPAGLNPQFLMPNGAWNWLAVVGMVPWLPQSGLPVPVAGALYVEVWAYALMPLFARSRSAALLGTLGALAANLDLGFGLDSFVPRYTGFATGLLAFGAGALVCHWRDALRPIAWPVPALLAWGAHCVVWIYYPYWPWTYGMYASVLLSAWVVASLAECRTGAADGWLGDLSYPVYLLHTMAGAWFLPVFGPGRSFGFFCAAFAVTLGLSLAMVAWLEIPLRRLKRKPGRVNRVHVDRVAAVVV